MIMGYHKCYNDYTLFVKKSKVKKVIVLLVYVDDIIITSDDDEANQL